MSTIFNLEATIKGQEKLFNPNGKSHVNMNNFTRDFSSGMNYRQGASSIGLWSLESQLLGEYDSSFQMTFAYQFDTEDKNLTQENPLQVAHRKLNQGVDAFLTIDVPLKLKNAASSGFNKLKEKGLQFKGSLSKLAAFKDKAKDKIKALGDEVLAFFRKVFKRIKEGVLGLLTKIFKNEGPPIKEILEAGKLIKELIGGLLDWIGKKELDDKAKETPIFGYIISIIEFLKNCYQIIKRAIFENSITPFVPKVQASTNKLIVFLFERSIKFIRSKFYALYSLFTSILKPLITIVLPEALPFMMATGKMAEKMPGIAQKIKMWGRNNNLRLFNANKSIENKRKHLKEVSYEFYDFIMNPTVDQEVSAKMKNFFFPKNNAQGILEGIGDFGLSTLKFINDIVASDNKPITILMKVKGIVTGKMNQEKEVDFFDPANKKDALKVIAGKLIVGSTTVNYNVNKLF